MRATGHVAHPGRQTQSLPHAWSSPETVLDGCFFSALVDLLAKLVVLQVTRCRKSMQQLSGETTGHHGAFGSGGAIRGIRALCSSTLPPSPASPCTTSECLSPVCAGARPLGTKCCVRRV